jgi:acylphosphatase
MEATDLTFHGFAAGRVQGVFFRAETRRKAIELGLSGWVKNLDDGRVEFLISGSEQALAQMRSWLQTGPRLARVDQLVLKQVNQRCGSGFQIHQ